MKTKQTLLKPILKGSPLHYPDAVALRYWRKLDPIFSGMAKDTEREVLALFKSPVAKKAGLPTLDAGLSEDVKKLFNRLLKKYSRIFERDLPGIAGEWIAGVDQASKSGLAASLDKMSGLAIDTDFLTSSMGEQLKALTISNVSLFKTIAADHFEKVESAVINSIISGNGMQDLQPFFDKHSTVERNYAKNRALDQTRKAYTSVNLARMKKLGVKKVEWIHSHGSNDPRKLHQELNGKIFDLDDPPFIGVMYGIDVHGWGGELPNCRCMTRPIIDFDDNDEEDE